MKIPKLESKTVEFKTSFNQDTIVSLVAFANAEGGSVYIGVSDDGKVCGVQLSPESETAWVNEIKSKTAPSIVPEADRINVGGKTVVRLHVSPLPVKPASIQGRYYVRKSRANHLMSLSELSELYLDSISTSWDAMPSRYTLDDISLDKVAAFAKFLNPDNPDDPLRVLRKLNLLVEGRPTNACYLAFAADYCRESAFQTGRFKTQTLIVDDRTFNADLFETLSGVMSFVKNHLMAGLVITGNPRHEVRYDYPVDAIREIILNMIVHRDYRELGVNTIKIFDDRIEFTNPGGLPHGLTVKKLLSDAYVTKPRNVELASLFKSAGLIERYGSGIRRILESCRMHGEVDVEFEDHQTWFRTVLRKKLAAVSQKDSVGLGEKLGEKLGENRTAILEALKKESNLSIRDLALRIGISETALEKNMAWLRSHGYILRVGPRKGGYWEVLKR